MLIEVSAFWIVTLNIAGWLVVQFGLAWLFLRMPARWFDFPGQDAARPAPFFYERILRIKSWKHLLPDAAGWFGGGVAKASLATKSPAHLRRFMQEALRGEICHWLALLCAPLFLIWTPWRGFWGEVAYAVAANLPCILTLRYNRARIRALLERRRSQPS